MRLRLSGHAFGTVDTPTATIHRVKSQSQFRVGWKGLSAAFLPMDHELEIEFEREIYHSFLVIDESYFKGFAETSLVYRPQAFKHFAGKPSPVGASLMRALQSVVQNDDMADWPMLTDYIATAIAAHLIRLFTPDSAQKKSPDPDLSAERMTRVIDFIEANISKEIHLEELAASAALSVYHFVRLFQRHLGVTPMRFVWQRRIEHAKLRLRHRTLPLSGIASDCGFSSQSHFATVFKRETGMTPTEYRRQL